MASDFPLLIGLPILLGIGFVGFWAVRSGPPSAQTLARRSKDLVARAWYVLANGLGWFLWLALSVWLGVELMIGEGEPLIVVAFIAPLASILLCLAALLFGAFVLGSLLGWVLLVASVVDAGRGPPTSPPP